MPESMKSVQPLRVMVLDDDTSMRKLTSLHIAGLGHVPVAFANALEAMRAHHEEPFELLMVDWIMPDVDGLKFVKQVRSIELKQGQVAPYIIMLTGKDRSSDIDAALGAGVDDYLMKPFTDKAIDTRVRIAAASFDDRKQRVEAESARLASEQSLARSERELSEVINKAPYGIALLDDGGTVIYANPAARRLFGSVKPTGVQLVSLVIAEDRETLQNALDESSSEDTSVEVRAPLSRGVGLLEILPGAQLEFQGRPTRLMAFRDVTDQRLLMERLQAADRLTSLGTLAAGVGHEINNPLGYVLANVDFLSEAIDERSPGLPEDEKEEILAALSEAREGALRVAQIVKDLNRFSDDRQEQPHRPVSIKPVVEAAVQMTTNQLRHRGRIELDVQELPAVLGNEGRLLQVFVNILNNAAQALDESQIETNVVRVRGRLEDEVVVEIEDTGSGIDPEVRKRVFDPFFTTKPIGVGSGLGLSISHAIVSAHHGRIEIESGSGGVGSIVRVWLPTAESAPAIKPLPPQPSVVPRARVLVIDDEPLVGRALKRALAQHEVVTAQSARQALELLRTETFDVIFCDLMMPDMSGMELYDRLGHFRPEIRRRIIFMTGGAFTPRARDFLESVDNRMIEKPFGIQMVRTLVASQLREM